LVLLAVGVVLLDYSSQAAINPCEALVSDIVAEVIITMELIIYSCGGNYL